MKLNFEALSSPQTYGEVRTENPLMKLGEYLRDNGYFFTPITPAARARVLDRPHTGFSSDGILREFFGWGRMVPLEMVPSPILLWLNSADMLELSEDGQRVRSRIRATTLGTDIYLHSTDPLVESDGVYLSPDVHQYIKFLKDHVVSAHHVVELNCGTGAGGLSLAERAEKIDLIDSSAVALDFSRVNASLTGAENIRILPSHMLAEVEPGADVIISHPQDRVRDCRDYGVEAPLQVVDAAVQYLRPGGKLLLFTSTCIVAGRDMLHEAIQTRLEETGHMFHFEYLQFEGDVTELGLVRDDAPLIDRKLNVGVTLTARHS